MIRKGLFSLLGIIMIALVVSASVITVPQGQAAQHSASLDAQNESQQSQPSQQGQPVRYDDIRFERISAAQGLSQSVVNCIIQDSFGFLWFGTQDGLNKYDGYTFKVYKHNHNDPSSLSKNWIRAVYEDSQKTLWIGAEAGGLSRFDRENNKFINYQNDPNDASSLSNNTVTAILENNDVLWIGTQMGLNRFDRPSQKFANYLSNADVPKPLRSGAIHTIHADRTGILWIGTNDGLIRYSPEEEKFNHYRFSVDSPEGKLHFEVTSIAEDASGALWIGTSGGGIYKLAPGSKDFVHIQAEADNPKALKSDDIQLIYTDRQGDLWVATNGGGLHRFEAKSGSFIHYKNNPFDQTSLSSDYIASLYEDTSGVFWVGLWGAGLNKFDRQSQQFTHYHNLPGNSNSLVANLVWALYEDHTGLLWIGTHEGLSRLDQQIGVFKHYRKDAKDPYSLSSNQVRTIYEDHFGNLWIGTFDGGLNQFIREKGKFIHYVHRSDQADSISSNSVSFIQEDPSGLLWIGTMMGLDRLDPQTGKFTHYLADPENPDSLSDPDICAGYLEPSGILWLGTPAGLNRFDPSTGKFKHYLNDPEDLNSLSENHIIAISQDSRGILWLGTVGGGLNRFDPSQEKFTAFTENDGLPDDTVYGILEDEDGLLWISTNKGLSRFDPQLLTFKNYEVRDGLQDNEFNAGAYFKSQTGKMFFGGINGFSAFYPGDIRDNLYVPPIILTSLTRGGTALIPEAAVETISEIVLRWPDNFFEFEFAALSYSKPDKNRYTYMLDGFDQDWIDIGNQRIGKYTNLPGGTYTLRLRGANEDGIWNREGSAIQVKVIPPVWETLWFQALAAGGLVLGAFAGYRLRVKDVERRNRELESLVQEKTSSLRQTARILEERTAEIDRRRRELEVLYHADEELYRNLNLDEVLQSLVDTAVNILSADKGALMVWNEQQTRLIPRVVRGFQAETVPKLSFAREEGIAGMVAVTGVPAVIDDARSDPRATQSIVIAEGILSFMQVPIKVGGEVFGVFSADFTHPRKIGDADLRLLISLAERAALAIQNAQLYEKKQELAVVEERSRLARELHDAVTQTLFSASLIAEALPASWENDPKEGKQLLNELRQLSRGALAEMRTLLLELRPAALVETSLEDLLRQLAEAAMGREGIPVRVIVEGRCILQPDVHIALYRISQEALNNVFKHARASQINVHLRYTDSAAGDGKVCAGVILSVSDDGRGFNPDKVPPDHLGLRIMRERAQAIGANLLIESQPGHGAQVMVVWEQGSNGRGSSI